MIHRFFPSPFRARTPKRRAVFLINKSFSLCLSGVFLALIALFSSSAVRVAAQSPNTASIIVVVTDQNGAVVPDANVTALNNATGDRREVVSGGDGNVTITALPLTGTYTVTVSKQGFGSEELKGISLRAGETATLKVTLFAGAQNDGSHGLRHDRRRPLRPADWTTARQPANRRNAHSRSQGDDSAAAEFSLPAGKRHGRPFRQSDVFRDRRRRSPSNHRFARRRE